MTTTASLQAINGCQDLHLGPFQLEVLLGLALLSLVIFDCHIYVFQFLPLTRHSFVWKGFGFWTFSGSVVWMEGKLKDGCASSNAGQRLGSVPGVLIDSLILPYVCSIYNSYAEKAF